MEQIIYSTLVQRFESVMGSHPEFDIFTRGQVVDAAAQRRPFIFFQVDFDETRKASIEEGRGVQRFTGALAIGIFVRPTAGDGEWLGVRADLREAFTSQYVGDVLMNKSLPFKPREMAEWSAHGFQCLFSMDKVH